MRVRWGLRGVLCLLTVTMGVFCEANGRRPVPIVREADFSGKPYLSLDDVAQVMDGQVHAFPVSKRVDLSFRSHDVQFSLDSDKATVDGESSSLDVRPMQDSRGVWVPKSFFRSGPLADVFFERID